MFSHVMVGSNDIERSKRFYDAVLGVLGASEPTRNQNRTGQVRLFYRHDGGTFCVSEPIDGEPATVCQWWHHRLQVPFTRAGAAVPRRSYRTRWNVDRRSAVPA